MAVPERAVEHGLQRINIRLDERGEITVDTPYFQVSKGSFEQVLWVCDVKHSHAESQADPCFTVDFEGNGSPFYETQFSSDSPYSGLVRRDILAGPKRYKYTVRVGDKTLDPYGGVKP
jgi:hypothetical protein